MRATLVVVVVALAAVFATSAFAGDNSSANSAYSNRGTKTQQTISKPKAPKPSPSVTKSSGTLPFTGLDLALIAGGGVLLVVTGASLRRVTRKPSA